MQTSKQHRMNTKYIFVTGGVVSSLGKGIISASIGKLLQARGFKVTIQKFDPYINIDPGTLNPYEHGECYVTEDGFETDLDLGHYERFTGIHTTRNNSITTGRIYKTVIDRERHGDYLGKTIQVVPHITDEIKRRMLREGLDEGLDFVITEVGGTIGDIESAPFMEAIRQLRWQLGHDAVCVHLTYVPYLKAADELKTKPTQHSVKELQGMGIQPDILVLRTERHLDDHVRIKVASFCNVDLECVVQSEDMPSIYEVPVSMQKQGLDAAIMRKIGIPVGERRRERLRVGELRSGMGELCSGMGDGTSGMTPAMKPWHDFLDKQRNAKREIHIGLVGKYNLQDAYKSIRESLNLAGIYNDVKARLHFINSEEITSQNIAERLRVGDGTSGMKLADMAGIVICPGFGQRGIEGKIIAAEYTRSHDIPTFGICLGMQMMVIEFARNVLGYKDANSREMDEQTPHNVIDIMEEQKSITQMGGTMRLGAYECELREGSKAAQAYSSLFTLHSSLTIKERHRHRYEFNNTYKEEYEAKGMKCVGINPAADLVEIVEIPDKRWYIGTQFHPEYSSTVLHPHPLFMSFIKECAQENP